MPEGRTHKPVINPEQCETCDVCARGCPAVLIPEYRQETGSLRGAVFTGPQAVQPLREHAIPPCQAACPVRQDARRYLRLIAEERFLEALDVIRDTLPFPGIIGRICHRPCEQACVRGKCLDEPLIICGLKRFVADYEVERREPPAPPVGPDRGKSVAIIGGGPSGMACALCLRRSGYSVTIFEKEKELGGALYWGIPGYRLPREVLRRETAVVARAGVRLRLNISVGRDISLKEIRDTFDTVYIACGAQGTRKLGMDHENAQGVLSGVDFLRHISTGGPMGAGRNVVVVGGGNVAIDAALTAKQLGEQRVTLVCLEEKDEMPADPEEVERALLEGVIIRNSWGPRRILAEEGRVTGIELKQCTVVFDESGRFDPRYDDKVKTLLPADMLIIAIGQLPQTDFLRDAKGIETAPDGWIAADPVTLETGIPGVFSGGDIVAGSRTAIEAIEAGQRAASSIERYLCQKGEQGAGSPEMQQEVGQGS